MPPSATPVVRSIAAVTRPVGLSPVLDGPDAGLAGHGPPRHGRLPLAVLCVVAMTLAAGVHVLLFADGSLNNDEVAYLLQAKAMAHGHLFLDVRPPAEATRIWFFVERSPGLVSKYLPLVSGLFAVGLRLTGSIVPVLAALAGVLPLLVVALAREVGFGTRRALMAAALFRCPRSPSWSRPCPSPICRSSCWSPPLGCCACGSATAVRGRARRCSVWSYRRRRAPGPTTPSC